VTAHLLGGMTLLSLLVWLILRESPAPPPGPAATGRRLAGLALVVLVVQIALGGWVSSNYAVLACPDFPLCQGAWAPSGMDFSNGFALWRNLGMTGGDGGQPIPFQALVAIHWVHRAFAVIAAFILALTAWSAYRDGPTRRTGAWLAGLLVLQLLTGMSNVIFQWPLLLAVLHNAGAAAMLVLVVTLNHRAWRAPAADAIALSAAPAKAAE
jgi:cytochrome c oxidase assembly protein subunit 15